MRGSTLSEVGPAIFVLVVIGLLPTIDLIFMGIDYAATYTLNELQLREAQKSKKSQAMAMDGAVISTIPAQWRASLLGGLAPTNNIDPANPPIQTQIAYQPVPWKPVGAAQTLNFWFVIVTTTVQFRPFLIVPFMGGVPGLGAPLSITVTNRRPVENNRYLNE